MNRKFISIIAILFLIMVVAPNIFALFSKLERYSVSTKNALIYATVMSTSAIKTVPFGMPLKILDQKAGRVQFELDKQNYWIALSNLTPINFSQFTTSSTMFISSEVTKKGDMFFIYKNQMYSFNITNQNISFKPISKIPNLLDATPSTDRNLWMLLGEIRADDKAQLNIGLFNVVREKFTELTIFSGDVTIELAEFSSDNNYLALFVNKNNINHLYVFDIQKLSLVMTDKQVNGFTWNDHQLVVYYEHKIALYDTNPWREVSLKNLVIMKAPSGINRNGKTLIQNQNQVYLISNNTLILTKYKSLDHSPEGKFEQYQIQAQTITTFNNYRIGNLSGQKPKWYFQSFIDDRYLLYKEQKDALITVYRYDAVEKKSQPYYWIEDPYSIFGDGILVDVATEGDEVWIFIESLTETPKILKLHQLL
ncbi:MAG: hypothetical protein ACRCTJ_03600 [Brevinema sp.]